MIISLYKIYWKKISLLTVPNLLFFTITILIIFQLNSVNNSTHLLGDNEWNEAITSIEIQYFNYNNFMNDKSIELELNEYNIQLNTFYLLEIRQSEIFIRTQYFGDSNQSKTEDQVIHKIIFPVSLSSKTVKKISGYQKLIDLNIDLLTFNRSDTNFAQTSLIINSTNVFYSLNNYTTTNEINNPSKILNGIEYYSKNSIKMESTETTLYLSSPNVFSSEKWGQILTEVISIKRIDYWDLPKVYPNDIENLYNFVSNIQNTMLRKMVSHFDITEDSYTITINENLLRLIEEIQFKITLTLIIIYLLIIPIVVFNIRNIRNVSNLSFDLFEKFIKIALKRGMTANNLVKLLIKFLIIIELTGILFILAITSVIYPDQFIQNYLLIIVSITLISIFSVLLSFKESIRRINSINTLYSENYDFLPKINIINSIQKTIFLLIASLLTVLIYNKINPLGSFFIFLYTVVILCLFYLVPKIVEYIAYSFKDVENLFQYFNLNLQSLSEHRVKINKTKLFKWYKAAFMIIVIFPLLFSNLSEIDDYTTHYSRLHTISDVYLEGVNENEVQKLITAPNLIDNITIRKMIYNGETQTKAKTQNLFFSIIFVDFQNLKKIINEQSFQYLDGVTRKILEFGVPNQNQVLISEDLASTLEVNSKDNIMLTDIDSRFTINSVLHYFPSIEVKYWIIVDTSNSYDKVNELISKYNLYMITDWIGKIENLQEFKEWHRDNIGYSKWRTDVGLYYTVFLQPKLFFFSVIDQNLLLLQILLIFTEISVIANFMYSAYKINSQFKTHIPLLIKRGCSRKILFNLFVKDLLITMSVRLLIVLPFMLTLLFTGNTYLRYFRGELPNLTHTNISYIVVGPIILTFLVLIFYNNWIIKKEMRDTLTKEIEA